MPDLPENLNVFLLINERNPSGRLAFTKTVIRTISLSSVTGISRPDSNAYRWRFGGGVDLAGRVIAVRRMRHLLRDNGHGGQRIRLILFHLL